MLLSTKLGPTMPVKVGLIWIGFSSWFHRAVDTVGFISGFEDMGAIGDVIQQRCAQAAVGEDGRLLRERQVGGDDDLPCSFVDDLEEHLSSDP